MSREIKFRAWDNKKKEWLCGYEMPNLGGFSIIGETILLGEWSKVIDIFLFSRDGYKPDDLRIMQFTGLKDNKGKDIYEGDIVGQFEDEDNLDYEEKPSKWLRVIEWNDEDGAWGVMNKEVMTSIEKLYEDDWDEDYCFASDIREMEVIGNIYENPELK